MLILPRHLTDLLGTMAGTNFIFHLLAALSFLGLAWAWLDALKKLRGLHQGLKRAQNGQIIKLWGQPTKLMAEFAEQWAIDFESKLPSVAKSTPRGFDLAPWILLASRHGIDSIYWDPSGEVSLSVRGSADPTEPLLLKLKQSLGPEFRLSLRPKKEH